MVPDCASMKRPMHSQEPRTKIATAICADVIYPGSLGAVLLGGIGWMVIAGIG